MMKGIARVGVLCSLALSACAVRLASLADKTSEQQQEIYAVTKDVSYGPEKEQALDLYRSGTADALKRHNFTVVFLHGGGYFISDKAKEERYIRPYLAKGMNVVNMNYRLKRGIPVATEDLTYALNFLHANNATYGLNLDRVILTGFSAGAHIASLVAVTANDPTYPHKLDPGIRIAGVINFSGPVDGLNVVERVFMTHDVPLMKEIGNALFVEYSDYAPRDFARKFEPITYFDRNDPPFFIWQGGKDDQVPPETFTRFVALLHEDRDKNEVLFVPDGLHSPKADELSRAYAQIFRFLDKH